MRGNLGNVKEKPTRKTCFCREKKHLQPGSTYLPCKILLGGISVMPTNFLLYFHAKWSSLENHTSSNTTQHDTTRVQHNTTRNNKRQHKYNTTQHEYNTTQHETTRVQHKTTRVQHNTTQVQHSINFILIYLHHSCPLGTWNIKTKALVMFQNLENWKSLFQ